MDEIEKYRVGLVGCGRISARHIEAIRSKTNDLELVGVCDIENDALQRTVLESNVEGFNSLNDLLKQDLDVLAVTTPSGLHPQHAVMGLASGAHVVSEKPMATKWSDAKMMLAAAKEADRKLFVVKQHRFHPIMQHVKSAIESGRFGRVYTVSLNVFWNRPQSYYDLAAWRGTWELDGGALMNQSIHYIDILVWLFGNIESVQAYMSTLDRRIEVEDTAVMNLEWRGGTLGSVNVTMLTHSQNFSAGMTIVGERGTVRLGGVACNRVDHWEFLDPVESDASIHTLEHPDTVYGVGHPAFYSNVVDVLRGESVPYVDGAEGMKSLEVVIAAYRSAKEARRISLPLE